MVFFALVLLRDVFQDMSFKMEISSTIVNCSQVDSKKGGKLVKLDMEIQSDYHAGDQACGWHSGWHRK